MTVQGWQEVVPAVTVDRVGVFMHPMHLLDGRVSMARLVTEVSIRDGQKHIALRSTILVRNEMAVALEFKLEQRDSGRSEVLPPVYPGQTVSIPLHLIGAIVRLRVAQWDLLWSTPDISWDAFSTLAVGDQRGTILSCERVGSNGKAKFLEPAFFCCASVRREPVPLALEAGASFTLTLFSPLVLQNLLPVEATFFFDSGDEEVLRPGASRPLLTLDVRRQIQIRIKVPGFQRSTLAIINGDSPRAPVDRSLMLPDSERRMLTVDISNVRLRGTGGARKVSIYAAYWMVNRTALPLVFRQSSRSQTAAGQSTNAGELCRPSLTMFSCDDESLSSGHKCCVRIGKVCWFHPTHLYVIPFLTCSRTGAQTSHSTLSVALACSRCASGPPMARSSARVTSVCRSPARQARAPSQRCVLQNVLSDPRSSPLFQDSFLSIQQMPRCS